jgi:hypothetical protein
MGVITKPTTHADGTVPTAAQFNSNFDTIYTEFNGNIENANIKAGAAIAESKLALDVTSGHDHDGVNSKAITIPSITQGCKVTRNANQSINDSSNTNVAWDNEVWDTDTMHDPSTNPERVTITTTGKYAITLLVRFVANGTGLRSANLCKNGVSIAEVYANANAALASTLTLTAIESLTATDYLTIVVRQESTGALNLTGGAAYNYISVHRVS